ncbi:hypothetical protein DFH06DRAFT_1273581 [Mycena polygramma]|nr:hypothetical protein DFH06DRAFT_1273581 [Mycena polygramma]
MVATEIWKLSGYRFTVKDHKKLKSGHRTRFYCSQDEARKKKSKATLHPDIRNRDNVGMKRFPCGSKLSISCRARKNDEEELDVTVQIKHAAKHVSYVDVSMPPEALDMIRENVEWLTPVAMVSKVQAAFPNITAAQIHRAWMDMSSTFWRYDDDQLLSAKKVLEANKQDVDIFEPQDVPEGVEMLCWGMKNIAEPLKGQIIEHDGAGFPLSYLLLSTATSIDQGKRTKALTAWAKCVRDTYGVEPRFSHVDKDMAEIHMLKDVWKTKISLCWWHLRRAVRTRLANAKLATTPYDPGRAHAEFSFIDVAFIPRGQADGGEYEGGVPDTITPIVPPSQQPAQSETRTMPNGLRITIPARQPLALVSAASTAPRAPSTRATTGKENEPSETHGGVQTRGGRVTKPTRNPDAADPATDGEEEEAEKKSRRTFCPAAYRDSIESMMNKHYCAHPLLPGYAHPSPEGIKRWAVMQMYKFCVEHELREVWAYLWENWYRSSRWELWARSVHPEIPVLKTTMILESHWRRIKHDFLHHFHMPRCDLLAWILITKLAPNYYRKLDRLLTDTGRYRELPCWRKDFKRDWKKLARTPITLPVNPAYQTDTKKMICTCVQPVPPVFFLEVKRQRTAPFWVHPALRPLSDGDDDADETASDAADDTRAGERVGWDDDDEDDIVDTHRPEDEQLTFDEAMDENIDVILEFAKGLKFQRRFRDQRMLQALEREGASFLRLARACLGKEKRLKSTRGSAPSTWDKSTGTAMFYRARPAPSAE